jgi:cyclic pyranopterin monophosphate synthase
MLTHVTESGRAGMVNVGGKEPGERSAIARSVVVLPPEVSALLRDGELHAPKGPVFQTAIIAGTMAAKRTSELIPFCHPLAIESCAVTIGLEKGNAVIECRVSVHHRTGVEMEALTGASVAALTIYDMCKSVSRAMVIAETRLLEKHGGKSDAAQR